MQENPSPFFRGYLRCGLWTNDGHDEAEQKRFCAELLIAPTQPRLRQETNLLQPPKDSLSLMNQIYTEGSSGKAYHRVRREILYIWEACPKPTSSSSSSSSPARLKIEDVRSSSSDSAALSEEEGKHSQKILTWRPNVFQRCMTWTRLQRMILATWKGVPRSVSQWLSRSWAAISSFFLSFLFLTEVMIRNSSGIHFSDDKCCFCLWRNEIQRRQPGCDLGLRVASSVVV